MARRRSRGHRSDDGGGTTGFSERIATATKGDPSRLDEAEVPTVMGQGLTRYQRRTANLPSGATPMSGEDRTNIVIDLRRPDREG
jgi:hypothetical protein